MARRSDLALLHTIPAVLAGPGAVAHCISAVTPPQPLHITPTNVGADTWEMKTWHKINNQQIDAKVDGIYWTKVSVLLIKDELSKADCI